MKDPVRADDGYVYEREAIVNFINKFHMSPITFRTLNNASVSSHFELQTEIAMYKSSIPQYEFEDDD
jgi:hypothetical protein